METQKRQNTQIWGKVFMLYWGGSSEVSMLKFTTKAQWKNLNHKNIL